MNRAGSSSKIGSLKKESLPNENIFKSDSDYKMKSTLSFNEYEEQTCKRNLFIRYCDIIKFMIIYCCLRNVYCLFTEWNHSETHWLISIMRIPICLILLFNGLMVINIDKFINNTIYMRLFLEIDNIFNIITSVRLDNRLIADETLSGSNFYYAAIMLKFIHGFVYNFSFCLTLDEYFIYYLIESATIISLLNHPNKLCLIRLVYNLFSYKSIYVFAIATFIMGLQYQIASALRELWALYDSFKRSYVNIKGIYDEFRYPVFVVKKLGLQVYFKNVEADKLLNRKKAREMGDRPQSKMSSRRATSKYDITLRDIFEKSELLEEEICKCLRNKSKCFNFPMNIGNKTLMYKENDNFPTMYEGDLESVEWVKILVFECQWKGNEALMVN